MLLALTTILLLHGCSDQGIARPGVDGAPGEPGAPGQDGTPGSDGQSCWDLNGNGEADPDEDTNQDGVVDVLDCRGQDGEDAVEDPDDGAYFLGDLAIRSSNAAAYFCEHYIGIYGNLSLHIEAEYAEHADCIEVVDGDFTLELSGDAPVHFTNLMQVTGSLQAETESSVTFEALQTIAQGVRLDTWAVTDDVSWEFPALESVSTAGSDLEFYIYAATAGPQVRLVFPVLETVNGGLQVLGTDGVIDLGRFDALTTIGGDLQIRFNDDLSDVSALLGLATVGGSVVIEGNPNLPTSSATELADSIDVIGGVVEITGNGPD